MLSINGKVSSVVLKVLIKWNVLQSSGTTANKNFIFAAGLSSPWFIPVNSN